MAIKLNIPESLSEITLGQYQEWLRITEGKELNSFFQQKMIEIFCKSRLIDTLRMKAKDINVLDVRKLTSTVDYMVMASGTSTRHVKAISQVIVEESKKVKKRPIGVEGEQGSEWVLIDFTDILVHIMLPRVREFYNLEKLWSLQPIKKAWIADK